MKEEKIIRDEATYFTNRYLRFSTDTRAIEKFKGLKDRLKDFYSSEYKAIFLDQIEKKINNDLQNIKTIIIMGNLIRNVFMTILSKNYCFTLSKNWIHYL